MKILRANIWWNVVVPQVLGWIYFCLLIGDSEYHHRWYQILCFLIPLITTAAFGYLLNDYCDIESDKKAGKKNLLATVSPLVRTILVLVFFSVAVVSWFVIKKGILINVLYALQLIALIIYSVKPFRLKERALLGVLCDSFYGHINPALITLTFFLSGETQQPVLISLLAFITVVTCIKGIRNILLHQIDDRKKDAKAGLNTFVVKHGGLFTLYYINTLLYFEIFFLLLLIAHISYLLPPFILSLLLFSIITYLKFSGWKLSYLPKRQLKFKFLFFLNDYYERWMPVFFLLILCVHQPLFLILLLLHLVLFPSFITKLWSDIETIQQNFKTEEDY